MAGWQISQGKACHLHPIYPPHLLLHLPGDYWALDLVASSPRCSGLYAVAVRRAGTLLTASFGFHLTMDTLAVRLTVPITRVRRGLPPPSHSVKHHIRPSCVSALHAMPGTQQKNWPSKAEGQFAQLIVLIGVGGRNRTDTGWKPRGILRPKTGFFLTP